MLLSKYLTICQVRGYAESHTIALVEQKHDESISPLDLGTALL